MKKQFIKFLVLPVFISIIHAAPQPQIKSIRTLPSLHVIAYATTHSGPLFAASMEDNTIRIMNAATGQTLKILTGHPQPAYALAFSPDGKKLASGDESARIWLWDVASGKRIGQLPQLHQRGIQNLSFSPDGKLLASTGKDDVIRIYNVATGKIASILYGKGANYYSATFGKQPLELAAPTLGSGVHLYNIKNFQQIGKLDGHNSLGIMDIALHGSKGLTAGRDGSAIYWNMESKTPLAKLRGHGDWVMHVALSPNNRYGATSSSDRKVIVWDLKTGQPLATINNQCSVGSPVAFTGDGKYLLTVTDSDALQIHAITGGSEGVAKPSPKSKPLIKHRHKK